jgi:hypothetical protein
VCRSAAIGADRDASGLALRSKLEAAEATNLLRDAMFVVGASDG